MNDSSEPSTGYKPEEGAEVRPASRYSVAPTELVALARDVAATDASPYRSLSILAVVALVLAVAYSFVVALGGVLAFADRAGWVLVLGAILVPLLAIPVALKFEFRGRVGLLRFMALALALFFAVPVGVGGLIAFPSHAPWLLPLWTVLVPLLAACCGWAARWQIQASEDTLGGRPLTAWAMGLSLFFGLCYTAFYLATYIAISQQGEQFAGEWLDKLQKGDVERAFVLTIPPSFRAGKDTLPRETIELNYNARGDESNQSYSSFELRNYVRLLRGFQKANVELISVRDWGFEGGGYKLQLGYRVTTPYWSFPLDVVVQGLESQKDEYKGRRWFVVGDATGVPRGEIAFTPAGTRLLALSESSNHYADSWLKTLWSNENKAWLETLPAEEGAAEKTWRTVAAATGPGLREAQKSRLTFLQGDLVTSEEKFFWASPRIRQAAIDEIRSLFAMGSDKRVTWRLRDLKQAPWPDWKEEEGRLLFRNDGEANVVLPIKVETAEGPRTESSRVRIDLRLLVSCSSAVLKGEYPEWRVEGVEMVRARRVEEQNAKPGRR